MVYASLVFANSPTPFTYESEEDLGLGDLVEASLRNQKLNGVVVEISKSKPTHPTKPIVKVVRKNVLSEKQIEIAHFIHTYYASHFGKVLKLMIPSRVWEDKPFTRKTKESEIHIIPQKKKVLTSQQNKVLEKILNPKPYPLKPILLHGVTGSGKTEIYLRVILEVMKEGKQGILLVPEIALTPQLVGYFASSIAKERISVIHSNLSEGERVNAWEKIRSGEIDLVIGSRSALFSPTQNLDVVILDEEHEWNYKNDQTPRYHARAVAMKLCEVMDAKLILGSATPSIESYFFAKQGRVELLELGERIGNAKLPKVSIVDLRNEIKRENFSPISELLEDKIRETLERKQQVILLLNKRGFASSIVCRECGFVLECESCSLPLTFHSKINRCVCHACGFAKTPPTSCPNCKSLAIRFLGSGTQKIESLLPALFPKARILRADRDTTSLRGSHQKIYEEFRSGKADILVGTQIVAKGLDLPNVSLVGVILADIGLHLPDFRASEKIFSLLTQVSGRSGRGEIEGEVVIQTYSPTHPSIVNAKNHNYKKFFEEEILERKNGFWPPYSKVVKFIFVDANESKAKSEAQTFAKKLKDLGEKMVWVSPALITKLHNKFHYHVIWKGNNPIKLLEKIPSLEKVRVDVDTINLG